MNAKLTIAAAAWLALAAQSDESKPAFEPPVRLTCDGAPINQKEQRLYPSPVVIDVDGDGKTELVIGDLWGKFRIHRPVGKRGDLTWDKGEPLMAQGKELVVPNW